MKRLDSEQDRLPYRYGIVTALPKEFAAMRAMLDDDDDAVVRDDPTTYAVGTIPSADGGRHSVVVALLKKMGNNSASVATTNMQRSFPGIRDVLMVGIAYGCPNPTEVDKHVRLGDIVISDNTGIIQVDNIKLEDGEFKPRGYLPPPSANLLGRVHALEANRLVGQYPWEDHFARALKIEHAKRPKPKTDQLRSDDGTEWVSHPRDPDRTKRASKPRVHYGPIASANILVKDPKFRNRLRDTFGVRAGEMEGAGVADGTWEAGNGYLAIRGVCDYGDKTKVDTWQGYAAVVATAYARALLEATPRRSQDIDTSGAEAVSKSSNALANYLDAAQSASEEHPYVSLGQYGRGPLSAVYVERRLETPGATNKFPARFPIALGESLSTTEALAKHSNLLVYAPAGFGKSTMLARLVNRTIADRLTGSSTGFVPVRVSARGIARRKGGFVDVLTEQVNEELGIKLTKQIDRTLFEHPPGAGELWLVLVDGLDEIVGPEEREQLTRALQTIAKTTSGLYRFLVTSRPLETLGPFDRSTWGVYELPRFGKDQVELFAHRWFVGDRDRAGRFLAAIEQRRLTELSEIPLLLTLLAIVFDSEPARGFPTRRVKVFERFFEIMLDAEETTRRTRAQLVDQWTARFGAEGEVWAGRLFDGRREILAELGEIEIAGAVHATIDDALKEAKKVLPGECRASEAWLKEQLATLIDRAGVAAVSHGEIIFAHRSFAEYLAAQTLVRRFDPSQPEFLGGVLSAASESSWEAIRYALDLWSAEGKDCTDTVRALRKHGIQGALTAGAAVESGVLMHSEEADAVVDALIAVARRKTLNDILLQNRALELLGLLEGNSRVADGLALMVSDASLPDDRRGTAADQLGNLGRADLLLPWLARGDAPAYVLMFAGLSLSRLGHGSEVVRLLEPIVCDPSRPSEVRWDINKPLVQAGSYRGLAYLAVDPTANPGVQQVARVALSQGDRLSGLEELLRTEWVSDEIRSGARELLLSFGGSRAGD